MARFNVGDKVTIRSLKSIKKEFTEDSDGFRTTSGIYFVSDMNEYCGKTVTIAGVHKAGYRIKEDGGLWNWTDEMFEGHTIIIYTDNNKVVALDKATGKTGTAYCNPEDEFNFFIGADLAYNRLRGRVRPSSKDENVKKYYNGEIVCVSAQSGDFTKGKIYKVKNGQFRDDYGNIRGTTYPYINFRDLNDQHLSEFVEVVR